MDISKKAAETLDKEGIEISKVRNQFEKVQKGNPTIELVSPCTVGNGIVKMDQLTKETCREYFKEHFRNYQIYFFVPASGSGSRMFKDVFSYIENEEDSVAIQVLKERFNEFPFSSLIDEDLPEYYSEQHFQEMLYKMLSKEGLNLGDQPKCLIPFHRYGKELKTPIEEHVIMSLNIMNLKSPYLHFTIQKEHHKQVVQTLDELKEKKKLDFNYEISFQNPLTDAIAFSENGNFLNSDHEVLRRPGGHGALLDNLNQINADFVFLRNIDNVQHEDFASESVRTRQVLAGFLMSKVDTIHQFLNDIDAEKVDLDKVKSWLNMNLDRTLPDLPKKELLQWLRDIFNRPIRVCGMVKNTGLPGGGPFWVKDSNGKLTRQIIEKAQVSSLPEQKHIFEKSTHFNPVEIVGNLKDYKGKKFNLFDFNDENQYFLVKKYQKGEKIKYVEHPGLWNGSMSEWLTFFIEIPSHTFSPVKSVTDLLNPLHRGRG